MTDKIIPVILVGYKASLLRVEIDPITGAPTPVCPACDGRGIADVEARVGYFEHKDDCPLYFDGENRRLASWRNIADSPAVK